MKTLGIVAINVLVFLGILVGIEFYYRSSAPPVPAVGPANGLQLNFLPYVTFSNPPNTEYKAWTNIFTGKTIPANIRSNNQGYNDPRPFDWTKPYQKAPNEKVVLITGGSTVWDVGATSWDNSIAGQMQAELNRGQSTTKYTVINLGMGSWIAYQQFIALEMWGSPFNPDWVVIMDGHNDSGVGCGYSQGVTNPLFFPVIKSYIDGYLGSSAGEPVFYRGWIENEIIRFSAAYRTLTGKKYIYNSQVYDKSNKDTTRGELRKVVLPTKVGASRDMLTFYVKANAASVALFPKAKYILSTQPMVNAFTGDFVDAYKPGQVEADPVAMAKRSAGLDAYLKHHENSDCNTETFVPSFTYIYVKGAFEIEKLAVAKRAEGRFVEYHNIGRIFPNERNDRMKYFIDAAHVSDEGAKEIGAFFAKRVLAADLPAP